MKVSVCVVTYNHEMFISKCIDSILEQEADFEYEIIIAEDCSNDRTGEIVSRYAGEHQDKITLISRLRNVGVMQNYEDVFRLAKGEYISFLDGDDYMLPGKLSAQVSALDEHQDCSISSHPLNNFDSKTGRILSTPHKHENIRFYTLEDMILHGFFFSHSSKMFRKSSLPDEVVDKSTKNCTDYLLHMQNCLHGKVIHLNTVYGMHRVHSESLSRHNMTKGNIRYALDDQIYAIEKISMYKEIDNSIITKGYVRVLLWGLRKAILACDFDEMYRIKALAKEKVPGYKFPIIYRLICTSKLLVNITSRLYSYAYTSKNKLVTKTNV
ncbi:glycosyltransferase family 2 protein [Vibrio breoganii]|uniref:glycosyltransferase family 2 protein n=1 Tax=Vibrio breoganii TaxID=553239 RepID=UPI000CAD38B8|nr:glycosyltransferase [Vibrio breoganii]PML12524.1 hypothetical protein BCT84_15355 [Vibrio breoganii]